MGLEDQFAEDAEGTFEATDGELGIISGLADSQMLLADQIKVMEESLAKRKAELANIQEKLLPDAMMAIGMSEFKMANGYKLTIKEDVYASIRKDYVPQAVSWLDENKLGDIVKNEIKLNFARGEKEKSEQVVTLLKEEGYTPDQKMSVHPSTLKATVKEQQAKGVVFPEEFFSIAPKRQSIIKTK